MEDLKTSYVKHLKKCFKNAELGRSKIPQQILEMSGMTGKMTRHFYNNLLSRKDSRYIEIGTWMGSSVCSAMCNNKSTVLCIDNWSEFNGKDVKDIFFTVFNICKAGNDAKFIESDCFKVDRNEIGSFNIYLYDGGHSYQDHYKALEYYLDCMDDMFIFIVDDWNWDRVRNGTKDFIMDAKLNVLWSKEIRLTDDDTHTPKEIAKDSWWNGIGVFLLEKPAAKNIDAQN